MIIIPSRAVIHIQKIAPGLPATRAVATPTSNPVPTYPPTAVARAAKPDTLESDFKFLFITWKISLAYLNCGKPSLIE